MYIKYRQINCLEAQLLLRLTLKKKICHPGRVAQWVGESSHKPKDCRSDP